MAIQLNKLDPKLFRYLPLSEECSKIAAKNGASETQGVIAGFIGITTYVAAKSLGIDKQIARRGALAAAESVPNAAAAAKISTDKIIHPHQKYYAKLDAAAAMVARAADEGLTGADPVDRRKVAAAVEAALINITTLLNKIDMKNSRKNSTMSGGFGIGDVVGWVGKKAEDIGSFVGSFFHSPSNTTSSVPTPQQRDESVFGTVDFGPQDDDDKTTTTTTTTEAEPPFTEKQLEEAMKEDRQEEKGQKQVKDAVAKSKWKETLIGKLVDKINVWIKKNHKDSKPLTPREKRIKTWAMCGGLLFSALFAIGGVSTYFNPPDAGQSTKTTVDDLVAQFQEQQDDPNGLWVARNYTSQDIQRFEDYINNATDITSPDWINMAARFGFADEFQPPEEEMSEAPAQIIDETNTTSVPVVTAKSTLPTFSQVQKSFIEQQMTKQLAKQFPQPFSPEEDVGIPQPPYFSLDDEINKILNIEDYRKVYELPRPPYSSGRQLAEDLRGNLTKIYPKLVEKQTSEITEMVTGMKSTLNLYTRLLVDGISPYGSASTNWQVMFHRYEEDYRDAMEKSIKNYNEKVVEYQNQIEEEARPLAQIMKNTFRGLKAYYYNPADPDETFEEAATHAAKAMAALNSTAPAYSFITNITDSSRIPNGEKLQEVAIESEELTKAMFDGFKKADAQIFHDAEQAEINDIELATKYKKWFMQQLDNPQVMKKIVNHNFPEFSVPHIDEQLTNITFTPSDVRKFSDWLVTISPAKFNTMMTRIGNTWSLGTWDKVVHQSIKVVWNREDINSVLANPVHAYSEFAPYVFALYKVGDIKNFNQPDVTCTDIDHYFNVLEDIKQLHDPSITHAIAQTITIKIGDSVSQLPASVRKSLQRALPNLKKNYKLAKEKLYMDAGLPETAAGAAASYDTYKMENPVEGRIADQMLAFFGRNLLTTLMFILEVVQVTPTIRRFIATHFPGEKGKKLEQGAKFISHMVIDAGTAFLHGIEQNLVFEEQARQKFINEGIPFIMKAAYHAATFMMNGAEHVINLNTIDDLLQELQDKDEGNREVIERLDGEIADVEGRIERAKGVISRRLRDGERVSPHLRDLLDNAKDELKTLKSRRDVVVKSSEKNKSETMKMIEQLQKTEGAKWTKLWSETKDTTKSSIGKILNFVKQTSAARQKSQRTAFADIGKNLITPASLPSVSTSKERKEIEDTSARIYQKLKAKQEDGKKLFEKFLKADAASYDAAIAAKDKELKRLKTLTEQKASLLNKMAAANAKAKTKFTLKPPRKQKPKLKKKTKKAINRLTSGKSHGVKSKGKKRTSSSDSFDAFISSPKRRRSD